MKFADGQKLIYFVFRQNDMLSYCKEEVSKLSRIIPKLLGTKS